VGERSGSTQAIDGQAGDAKDEKNNRNRKKGCCEGFLRPAVHANNNTPG